VQASGDTKTASSSGGESLTYRLFGKEDDSGTKTSPPLKVNLPNQEHTYYFNGISSFNLVKNFSKKYVPDDPNNKSASVPTFRWVLG
jgi:hypothetical protein